MTSFAMLLNVVPEPSSHVPKVLNVRAAIDFAKRKMPANDYSGDFGDATGDDLDAQTDAAEVR